MSQDTLMQAYQQRFEEARHILPGQGIQWLDSLRAVAMEHFAEQGFPTAQQEPWKYTSIKSILQNTYALEAPKMDVAEDMLAAHQVDQLECYRLVFANGHLCKELSDIEALSKEVVIGTLDDAWVKTAHESAFNQYKDQPLQALNTSFMQEGYLLKAKKDTVISKPIHIIHLSQAEATPHMTQLRNVLSVEAGAKVTVIESFSGEGLYWQNICSHFTLAEGAYLQHIKLQQDANTAYHLANTNVDIKEGGTFKDFTLSLGGKLSRNEIQGHINGEQVTCELTGGFMARGEQHMDHYLPIMHNMPHGTSAQRYKGVLDGKAKGVFYGKVRVEEGAQQTNSHQENKNLLLSKEASVDARPELEIYANDVKCSHGSATGDLDPLALFYLQARGIDEQSAKNMLVDGFIQELVEHVTDEIVRQHFTQNN